MTKKYEQVDTAKEPEQKVWDLTPREIVELIEHKNKQLGICRLMDELVGMLGGQEKSERAFWQALYLRIGVSAEIPILANPKTGKVWIKGQVPELQ